MAMNTINGRPMGFSAAAQCCLDRLDILRSRDDQVDRLLKSTISAINHAMNPELTIGVRTCLLTGAAWTFHAAFSMEWGPMSHENIGDDIFVEWSYDVWNDLVIDIKNLVASCAHSVEE